MSVPAKSFVIKTYEFLKFSGTNSISFVLLVSLLLTFFYQKSLSQDYPHDKIYKFSFVFKTILYIFFNKKSIINCYAENHEIIYQTILYILLCPFESSERTFANKNKILS